MNTPNQGDPFDPGEFLTPNDTDHPVELKTPEQTPSDALQNPSDPDASYSGHKGPGYQVQVMETFCDGADKRQDALSLAPAVCDARAGGCQ